MRGGTFTYTAAGTTWSDPGPWTYASVPGNVLYSQDEIDIGGMTTTKEETFYPEAATIQNSPFYTAPGAVPIEPLDPESRLAPYGAIYEYVLITESPFKVEKWLADQNYTSGTGQQFITVQTCPGINPRRTTDQATTLGFQNILYGRVQMIAHNTSLPIQAGVVYSSNEFGSMTPTASDRLYVTRIVVVQPLGGIIIPNGSTIQLPHMRVILVGSGKEENDLSYIMRLRNSYLLQQDVN
jgi:hypothetical protein